MQTCPACKIAEQQSNGCLSGAWGWSTDSDHTLNSLGTSGDNSGWNVSYLFFFPVSHVFKVWNFSPEKLCVLKLTLIGIAWVRRKVKQDVTENINRVCYQFFPLLLKNINKLNNPLLLHSWPELCYKPFNFYVLRFERSPIKYNKVTL